MVFCTIEFVNSSWINKEVGMLRYIGILLGVIFSDFYFFPIAFTFLPIVNTKLAMAILSIPLLLIDDLGAEAVTPWARDEILCPLLQYRMDEKLPTFFTSNLDLKALENHLAITSKGDEVIKSGRIISRIKQLTEYQELISKNLRD